MSFVVNVNGVPVPQGSKRLGRNRKTGRAIIIDDNDAKLKAWRTIATMTARAAWRHQGHTAPISGACAVQIEFRLPRGKTVRREQPTVKPDIDKLQRALYDALTDAGVIVDDSLIVANSNVKRYARKDERAGAQITVEW